MRDSARRFYREHRAAVLTVAGLLLVNIVLGIVVGRYEQRAESLQLELDRGYGRLSDAREGWWREARRRVLIEVAEERMRELHRETLRTRKARYADVDREFKELAKRFGLNPRSFSLTHEIFPKHGVEKFVTSVPLKGDYQSLRAFIRHIEQSEEFFIIERISLSDSSERGSELNLQISVATYFSLPDAKLGLG